MNEKDLCLNCRKLATREASVEIKSTEPSIYSNALARYKATTGTVRCCDDPKCAVVALQKLLEIAMKDDGFMTPFNTRPAAAPV